MNKQLDRIELFLFIFTLLTVTMMVIQSYELYKVKSNNVMMIEMYNELHGAYEYLDEELELIRVSK